MSDYRRNIPPLRLKTFERFWAKVDKSAGLGPHGDCWEWRGATVKGYGNVGWAVDGSVRTFLAHRVSYFLVTGKQPGDVMCHTCDNPLCVRPEHLWNGTHAENAFDREFKGRGGHPDRTGDRNGLRKHPDSVLQGDAWHQAHAASEERRVTSVRRYHKRHPESNRGTRNPRSKLTEDDVRAIRAAYQAGGITQKALGARYGVSKTLVRDIMTGKLWSHVH